MNDAIISGYMLGQYCTGSEILRILDAGWIDGGNGIEGIGGGDGRAGGMAFRFSSFFFTDRFIDEDLKRV